MLKKIINVIFLFFVLFALSVNELSASGIGGFISGSRGAGSIDKEEESNELLGPDNDLDKHEHSKYKKLRFGLLFDTDPNPDSGSFRLIAGFGFGEMEKKIRRTEYFPDGSNETTYSNKTYNVLENYSITGCGYYSIIKGTSLNFCVGPQFTVSYSTEKKVSYSDFCFGPGVSAGLRCFLSERVYCTADLGLNAFYSVKGDLDLLYGDITLLFGLAVII